MKNDNQIKIKIRKGSKKFKFLYFIDKRSRNYMLVKFRAWNIPIMKTSQNHEWALITFCLVQKQVIIIFNMVKIMKMVKNHLHLLQHNTKRNRSILGQGPSGKT